MIDKIELLGAEQAVKDIGVAVAKISGSTREGIEEATKAFEAELRQDVQQSRFTGGLAGGISSRIEGSEVSPAGLILVDAPSARHAEFGRAVGKMPPPDALRDWVIRKTGDETALYPIARSIARKGTLREKRSGIPRGWGHIRHTINIMRGRISDTLIKAVSAGLRDLGGKK